TVVDENGEPLPGATVTVAGTTTGTVTDLDGNYSLTVPENSVIVFSFIGYETQRISLDNRSLLNVVMTPDMSSLDEVVVVGYGTQKRRDLTGSVSTVKLDDVLNLAVASPDAMLQGKAAGVQVIQNSGTPGAEVFVRVRGSASLLADSRPLYVIDGIPMTNIGRQGLDGGGHRPSALGDLNPNDIESIEVLKDAASAAIYGSRGAAGVILITTKKGKSGDAKINFNTYTGVQSVWRKLDLLEGNEMVNIVQESRANRGLPPDPLLVTTGSNTNWQDEIFRNAMTSSHNLSISGGNERMTSFVSVGYFNQDGTIRGQEFERFNGRMNLDYQATKFIKIGTNLTYSHTNRRKVANDFSGYSALGNALFANPNYSVRDEEGNWSMDPIGAWENPVMIADDLQHYATQKRFITNLYAEIQFHKNIKLRSTFGIDNLTNREDRFVPSYFTRAQGRALAQAESFDETVWQNENILSYTKTLDKHAINVMVGTTLLESRATNLFAGGQEAASDIIRTIAIADPFIPNHFITNWGLASVFGRANYAYEDTYLAEVSIRRDGSSRFGRDKRFGVFPAVSLGWRISEMGFLKDAGALNDLKLRASIGVTGNQEGISNFGSLALYGTGQNYNGIPGIAQSSLANTALGWETTVQTNIGFDVSMFNNRIVTYIDVYDRTTRDLLFERQLPWTSGFSGISRANLGSMQNRGVELMISTQNIISGGFRWSTDFNISWNRNKITELPDNGELGSDMIFTMQSIQSVEGPGNIYRVGQPVGSFWGYNYQGVYATDEDVPASFFSRGVRGGDFIFEDLNEDGIYSRAFDQMIIGNALPKHIGGMTNNFSYNRFDLSILLNWSYGNQIYNMTRAALEGMAREVNQLSTVMDRWQNPGDITNMPRPLYGTSSVSGASATDRSSRFVEDGSFLRLRNVTLGYNLPQTVLERLKVSNVRVYVSGQNLLTITNYSGFDPENQNIGNNTTLPLLGVDFLTQPQPKVYMIGLNVGF
ncbi:SusC/RagA family TonB-linked outer membrane protein, partial [Aquiflexum sp.]|uniref:SusC/RagA family TonB-linked outer membrane protein n=1 Tax=Aquiflexum sp. TaxID=1872584 RepID=UPI003593B6FA